MKVTVSRRELAAALAGLSYIVTKRATLPVLKGVLFHTVDGKLAATGTDLEQTATFRGFTATPDEKTGFVVPLAHLKRALVLCDGDTVDIENTGESVVKIRGEGCRMKLFGFPADEFPTHPANPKTVMVPAGDFVSMFRKVSATASTDESRAILNGVFSTKDGELVATDGRRMSILSGGPKLASPVVIRHTLFLLRATLGDDIQVGSTTDGTPDMELTSSLWTYRTKTIDGTFPNWRMVIPDAEPNAVFTIPDAAVKRLCARLSTIATKHVTPFELTGTPDGALVFKTNDPDDGEAEVTVKADPVKCGPSGFRIALNPAFFVTALQQGFTQWKWTDDISPMKATRADGSGVHVLMPMRMR